MATYTPRQKNWMICADDSAQAPTGLAAENAKPTLANNTSIVRIRVTLAEIGGKADNSVTMALQYDTNSGFTSPQSLGAAAHWNYADGQGTQGSAVTTRKLSDSAGTAGEFCESGTNVVVVGASTANEEDFAIVPTANVTSNTTYYFRLVGDGTAIALDTSETYPQVLTASVTNVTVSAGLCSGTASMLATSQIGAALVTAGLAQGSGSSFSTSVLYDWLLSAGLVSASGSAFAVEVLISGGDVTVALGLVQTVATVIGTSQTGDANVVAGLISALGQAFGAELLIDSLLTLEMIQGSAAIFAVTVDTGQEKKTYMFKVPRIPVTPTNPTIGKTVLR